MKHLITLVIVMITLGVNIVTAQKYLQNPKTGEITIQQDQVQLKELNVEFDSNVPWDVRTNLETVTEVLKKGNKKLSTIKIKGSYSYFILYFTPKTTSQIVYKNPDSKDGILNAS
jgi:hypothetical protein